MVVNASHPISLIGNRKGKEASGIMSVEIMGLPKVRDMAVEKLCQMIINKLFDALNQSEAK